MIKRPNGVNAMPDKKQGEAEKQALELLRTVDKLVPRETRPPGMEIGSAHHTLHRALEDIKVIASATIAWHRTHLDGVCRKCAQNEPWYCRDV